MQAVRIPHSAAQSVVRHADQTRVAQHAMLLLEPPLRTMARHTTNGTRTSACKRCSRRRRRNCGSYRSAVQLWAAIRVVAVVLVTVLA